MKASKNLTTTVELVAVASALVFPRAFVEYSALALGRLPLVSESVTHYAYGLLLVLLFSISSFVRKLEARVGAQHPSRKARWFSGLVVVGAIAMFYSIIASASGQVAVEDVVTPYFSYLLSVLFCIGVGYAISDVFSNFVSKE